jgi:ribosomal protein L12E/L44/L45/RPP1/RPP2
VQLLGGEPLLYTDDAGRTVALSDLAGSMDVVSIRRTEPAATAACAAATPACRCGRERERERERESESEQESGCRTAA